MPDLDKGIDIRNILQQFWANHQDWSISTESTVVANRVIVKATIANEVGRVIVTAHYDGDFFELVAVENSAIERAMYILSPSD